MPLLRSWPCAVALLLAAPAAAAEPAARADDFVDAIGVNVHWGQVNGLYDRNFDAIRARLADAGVRHLRDGAVKNAFRRGTELYDALGVRTTFIHSARTGEHLLKQPEYKSPLVPAKIADSLAVLKAGVPVGAVAAIEGPNEYDLFHDDRDPEWAAHLGDYQRELYKQVKADPDLKGVPVVGPSLTTHQAFQKVGDLSAAMDFGCGHFYRSTRYPGSKGWGGKAEFPPWGGGVYGSMDYNLAAARMVCGAKPIWSTETGYATPKGGVTEAVQGKYTPRLLAEFFRLGIRRTHVYELLDERADPKDGEGNFGLLRHDLSEKPAFTAIKSLIRLLNDNTWDAAGKRWTAPAFTPAPLDYTLAGPTANVRSVLLQKRAGDFYLLLWQEVADPAFHTEKWQPKYEKDIRVTLAVTTPVRPAVAVFTLAADGALAETAARVEGGALTVDVPDRITVVRLTPEARP